MANWIANHLQFIVYLRWIVELNPKPGGTDSVIFNHMGLLLKESSSVHNTATKQGAPVTKILIPFFC